MRSSCQFQFSGLCCSGHSCGLPVSVFELSYTLTTRAAGKTRGNQRRAPDPGRRPVATAHHGRVAAASCRPPNGFVFQQAPPVTVRISGEWARTDTHGLASFYRASANEAKKRLAKIICSRGCGANESERSRQGSQRERSQMDHRREAERSRFCRHFIATFLALP